MLRRSNRRKSSAEGIVAMIFSSLVAALIARYRAYRGHRQRVRELGIGRVDTVWIARQP
jgi:hypothetical protein